MLLGLSLARTSQQYERLLILVAAIMSSQIIVGVTNDLVDLEQDAKSQPWKPLVAELVTKTDAYRFVLAAVILLGVWLIVLEPVVSLLIIVGTIAGLAHNFWLKGTRFDWLSYFSGFTVLPITVWLALNAWKMEQVLMIFPSSFLLVAVILARDLPDIESDRAAGMNGLAARLGTKRAVYAVCFCLGMAALLAFLVSALVAMNAMVLSIGLILFAFMSLLNITRYLARPSHPTLRANFRLTVVSAVTLVGFCLFALRT
ncbi:MAG: UbiA family prenyltransferase [Chloroflexi bacterium]|nr:UbiA family prenyltransferase [Chloroflexota bacterium]